MSEVPLYMGLVQGYLGLISLSLIHIYIYIHIYVSHLKSALKSVGFTLASWGVGVAAPPGNDATRGHARARLPPWSDTCRTVLMLSEFPWCEWPRAPLPGL